MGWEKTNELLTRHFRTSLLHLASSALLVAVVAATSGCTAAVSVGINLIGSAVDSADVEDLEEKLIGAKTGAADEMLGERLDALSDLDSDRAWLVYPARYDPLGKDRYVVEIDKGKIVALSRVEKTPDAKFDIPRALIMESKVKGKPIAECQAELDLGKPILTVRSEATGLLRQLYEGRLVKDVGKPYYCILKFDKDELCEDVEFHGVGASTKEEPFKAEPESQPYPPAALRHRDSLLQDRPARVA
jgi:hypothetical protein